MKLKHMHIENFKGLKELDIPLLPNRAQSPRQVTCLVGDNGSGKTTALQAVALTLSLATRRTYDPTHFRWHGFLPERVGSQGPTRVELTVVFEQEEIELTRQSFWGWYHAQPSDWRQKHSIVEPADLREVRLVYENGGVSSPEGEAALYQFLGRHYIHELQTLLHLTAEQRELFTRLGGIFWFDQYRDLGTLAIRDFREGWTDENAESWKVGVDRLRETLVGWWSFHTSPLNGRGKKYINDLEQRFAALFPGTQFRGTMPREDGTVASVRDFYVLLERDERIYDIAEMSSGEQAIFSLLYDFVRLNIKQSVVLIDELELHLHPPAQQALYAALPKLGPDCQFIMTTHSEFLTSVIPDEQIVRLAGGRRCL